jgi:hypothetical protein
MKQLTKQFSVSFIKRNGWRNDTVLSPFQPFDTLSIVFWLYRTNPSTGGPTEKLEWFFHCHLLSLTCLWKADSLHVRPEMALGPIRLGSINLIISWDIGAKCVQLYIPDNKYSKQVKLLQHFWIIIDPEIYICISCFPFSF